MTGYYADKLSGARLRRCYEIASPRVQQYLESEIEHLLSRVRPADTVLELGCGYGRVALRLAGVASRVVGIDTSEPSLEMARGLAHERPGCEFLNMDGANLGFPDDEFDVVACVQNGICAFGVDQRTLVREALRVTRPGGVALFSTYADRFWPHRLAWFEAQAAEGLVGPIDRAASGDGTIVCTDGFRAGRLTPEELRELGADPDTEIAIHEVDGSSVFCELTKKAATRRSC